MIRRPRLLPLLALCLLLVSVVAEADEVRLLETDFEAAAARAEMLLDARDEVLASYFLIGEDPFALTALSMLRDAARRGVRVRLLVDAQWNKIPPAVQAHLLAEKIEIRTYHPFLVSRLGWISRRMHDKLMVTDGRELLAGGRNIESPYFGLGPQQLGRRNYIDCDVQVRGTTAALARDYFLAVWGSRDVDRVRVSASAADQAEAAKGLDGRKAWMDARIRAVRSAPVPALEPFVPVEGVRFLHDPVGRKGRAPGVGHELLALMNAAQESVIIESPYLVPSRAFLRGLRQARERGLRVRVLTNSLATTDNLFPQAGYVGHKKGLVANGVELWEATGPECLHAKTAVIDGRRAIVGSFNLDPRSEHLNTELALVLESPQVAETLLASMDAHLQHAVRIDGRGMAEGSTERYPGVPRSKVLRLHLLRWLAPLIKKQL